MDTNNPHKNRMALNALVVTVLAGAVIAVVGAIIVVVGFALSGVPAAAAPVKGPSLELEVLAEMNQARARNHRAPLRMLDTLTRPARAQSRYLLRTGLLTHDSPDGSPFWTRLERAGFPLTRATGENLVELGGCNESTARLAVQLWMQSPAHRTNMLSKQFHVTGLGAASSSDCDTTVITADYGG
jgi:uncharacterized protein YkwD